ncbi:hypothetical protein KIPB_011283, partial [Kipferlia bialata]
SVSARRALYSTSGSAVLTSFERRLRERDREKARERERESDERLPRHVALVAEVLASMHPLLDSDSVHRQVEQARAERVQRQAEERKRRAAAKAAAKEAKETREGTPVKTHSTRLSPSLLARGPSSASMASSARGGERRALTSRAAASSPQPPTSRVATQSPSEYVIGVLCRPSPATCVYYSQWLEASSNPSASVRPRKLRIELTQSEAKREREGAPAPYTAVYLLDDRPISKVKLSAAAATLSPSDLYVGCGVHLMGRTVVINSVDARTRTWIVDTGTRLEDAVHRLHSEIGKYTKMGPLPPKVNRSEGSKGTYNVRGLAETVALMYEKLRSVRPDYELASVFRRRHFRFQS